MTAFLDTSALVKRYADEDGSEAVRRLGAGVVSALSEVEIVAALWRKARTGELGDDPAALLTRIALRELRGGGTSFRAVVVPVTTDVRDRAITACGVHGLRAYDAVQLATAILTRTVEREVTDFFCFDRHLRRAAVREGFQVLP